MVMWVLLIHLYSVVLQPITATVLRPAWSPDNQEPPEAVLLAWVTPDQWLVYVLTGTPRFRASAARVLSKVARLAW